MTDSLIERVIDAAHDAANKAAGHDEYCSYEMAGAAVRAAIELIREPPKGFEKIVYHGDYADDVWRDMIDTLLKGRVA